MLNRIKKYRNSPERTVITFTFQKKLTLNRLGDLMIKENKEVIEKINEMTLDKHGAISDGRENDGYVLENDKKQSEKAENNPLKRKKSQIEPEQAQMLERDNCTRAFKENYHIKPLEFDKKESCITYKRLLNAEKEMRGGVVCEKSFKVLRCDLMAALGAVFAAFCLLTKANAHKRRKTP